MGENEEVMVVMFKLNYDEWIAKLEDPTQAVRGPVCEFMELFMKYLDARLKDAEAHGVRARLRRITSRLTGRGA